MAHMYMCEGGGCSLLLIYVFSLCLRALRKIDSSIGLPLLNKVVTYLLTYLLTYYVASVERLPALHYCVD